MNKKQYKQEVYKIIVRISLKYAYAIEDVTTFLEGKTRAGFLETVAEEGTAGIIAAVVPLMEEMERRIIAVKNAAKWSGKDTVVQVRNAWADATVNEKIVNDTFASIEKYIN